MISDYEYEDVMRVRDSKALDFMREVAAHYDQTITFAPRMRVLGIDFGPTERLPHDLKYMAPTIRIYKRR